MIALGACTGGQAGQTAPDSETHFATVLEAPIYPAIERLGPEPYVPTLQDRRWRFASRLEERNLPMLRRLKRGEMGNFGGIEWRWRDGRENDGLGTLTGIAYFLDNPGQSLRRYTQDPLFVAAQGDFSRVDQDRVARDWARRIGQDIASEGFGNMSTPWLDIAIPKTRFEAMRREKEWDIPVNLSLRFAISRAPDLPAIAEDLAGDIRYLAASADAAGATPDIATYDTIVLRDGCFFIDEEGDADPLVMVPHGVGVYRDGQGHIAFRSRYRDRQVRLARVGTTMQLGYRSAVEKPPAALIEACGSHRVVLVKSLDQAAGHGGQWFAVKEWATREGLSDAEAMQQANACLAGQEALQADRRLRASTAEPQPCRQVFHTPPPPPGV